MSPSLSGEIVAKLHNATSCGIEACEEHLREAAALDQRGQSKVATGTQALRLHGPSNSISSSLKQERSSPALSPSENAM